MMPSDTLTCDVTPNSVDPTSLSCSMPPLENLELWDAINSLLTTIGAWATVGATLLLAYFAWRAWNTSQATLKTMERQLEDQNTAALGAIEAQRELSISTRQRTLLADYNVALMNMAEVSTARDADFVAYATKAATAWTTWAMEMFAIDPELRELTGNWNQLIRQQAGTVYLRASQTDESESNYHFEMLNIQYEQRAVQTVIGGYIGKLQIWQVDLSRRQEMRDGLFEHSKEVFG